VRGRHIPPVLTPPPRLRSFGIPPANKPPSCGAAAKPPLPLVVSLLLRARLTAPAPLLLRALAAAAAADPGTGGAPRAGGLPNVIPPAPPLGLLSIMGALRSLVTAFLSLMPLVMSLFSVP
jgi:hypothetical protein